MSRTPIENHADLRIGMVEYISPSEIKVRLDIEAPDGIAANAGLPRAFPRINSYVLIPSEGGSIVCQIEWISIDRLSYSKKSSGDYGLIDLPLATRIMLVVPLGILSVNFNNTHKFQRGVTVFPSIGSPVLMPTDEQLKAIIESGSNRRVLIGTSPLTANAEVRIDPDRLFGRHLAVLGNTGSGKSCTVAGLIHWTLEATKQGDNANARFVILDPNGEYAQSFGDKATVFKVGDKTNPLEVPLWLWNANEWKAFTQAAPGIQFPLLRRALRAMRNENFEYTADLSFLLHKHLKIFNIYLLNARSKAIPWSAFPAPKNFYADIANWHKSLQLLSENEGSNSIDSLLNKLNDFLEEPTRKGNYPQYASNLEEIDGLVGVLGECMTRIGITNSDILSKTENVPTYYALETFITFLQNISISEGQEQNMDSLINRIQTLLFDPKMSMIIGDHTIKELDKWLLKYLGDDTKTKVSIIDLSLVPTEIVHIVTSVISRITFEALQRYRKLHSKTLPTVLVLEEAHTFISRHNEQNDVLNNSTICTKIFEKIAREGRKFGLGLVLSSQRPSELSPTVISQCNSFILHRISNDRDQDLVGRLLPDSFRGLLKELPSLPSQKAIILGWASELPLVFNVRTLENGKRPQSDDPDFWNVWNRNDDDGNIVERKINWLELSKDWQEKSIEPTME